MKEENIKKYMRDILKAGVKDNLHANNVTKQIETLSLIVAGLLNNNSNGVNDDLIGLYYHIGKSLRELETIQKNKSNE